MKFDFVATCFPITEAAVQYKCCIQNSSSENIRKSDRKTPRMESLFRKFPDVGLPIY